MLSVDLLISTMNYKPGSLDRCLKTVPDDVNVIIVNQVSGSSIITDPKKIKGNAICYSYDEKGLSKSRNRLIDLSTSEILVISDDDIEFLDGAFERIRESFLLYKNADILTFKMVTPDGKDRKNYKKKYFDHNIYSIGKVSSCEIGIRRHSLISSRARYDEIFGLGSTHPIGEEVIFLRDCIKSGLTVGFAPIKISSHPHDSTGKTFSEKSEFHRGSLFYRLYGFRSYFLGPVFYLKKMDLLSDGIGIIKALKSYFNGLNHFRSKIINKKNFQKD